MKKLLVLLMAVFSVSAAFSQNYHRNRGSNRTQTVISFPNEYNSYSQNNGYYNQGSQNYGYNNQGRGYDERYRQAEIYRINRDYDQRINSYRNNRYMNAIERQRRIREMEYERNQKLHSFGGGVVVGAIAGLILGAIISH